MQHRMRYGIRCIHCFALGIRIAAFAIAFREKFALQWVYCCANQLCAAQCAAAPAAGAAAATAAGAAPPSSGPSFSSSSGSDIA